MTDFLFFSPAAGYDPIRVYNNYAENYHVNAYLTHLQCHDFVVFGCAAITSFDFPLGATSGFRLDHLIVGCRFHTGRGLSHDHRVLLKHDSNNPGYHVMLSKTEHVTELMNRDTKGADG